LQKKFATGKMPHMKKTHGTRGKAFSEAFTISAAAREFAQDRGKFHRWIRAGVLKKCNEAGTYTKKGKFVWGADIAELLPERKRGKRLVPLKPERKSKWQLKNADPETTLWAHLPSPFILARQFYKSVCRVQDPAMAAETLRACMADIEQGWDHLRAVAMRQQKPRPSRRPAAA
jgi:hypothetical protein